MEPISTEKGWTAYIYFICTKWANDENKNMNEKFLDIICTSCNLCIFRR